MEWQVRTKESPVGSSNVSRKGKEKVDNAPHTPDLCAGYVDGDSSSYE